MMDGHAYPVDEPGDPPYITNLLSSEVEHNCYFVVGNPITGKSERIGVVPAMLMAHSLVLRRVLSPQETELRERWDITLPHVSPRTFKHLLKFSYGYNNIKSYTVQETLNLLKVGDMLVMHPMIVEASKHIVNIMKPSNICEILQEQVCLDYTKLEQEIANLIRQKTKEVFSSGNLQLVCPAGMRYIVSMDKLPVSQIEVWRTVINWARRKVLRDITPSNRRLEALMQPALIVPCLKHTRLCLFNLIAIVEEALCRKNSERDFIALISNYHYVSINSPVNTVSICDVDNGGKTIVHNSYDVKVIYNCSFWTDPEIKTSSKLVMQTPDCVIILHAIVCSGISKRPPPIENLFFKIVEVAEDRNIYDCKCTVRTTLITDTEKTEISKVQFHETAIFDEELKIPLNPNGKELRLEPNSKYILETSFSTAHPLWYANDIDYYRPGESQDLVVGCGLVNESKMWYGSHVKFLIYKKGPIL